MQSDELNRLTSEAKNDSEEQNRKNNNIENFQFDSIIRNKKMVKKKPIQQEHQKKPIEIKSKQKKVEYKPFKYGRNKFDDLNGLSQFLLREYHHIEKHATRLLNDSDFINWLQSKTKDEEQFKEWIKNIL